MTILLNIFLVIAGSLLVLFTILLLVIIISFIWFIFGNPKFPRYEKTWEGK